MEPCNSAVLYLEGCGWLVPSFLGRNGTSRHPHSHHTMVLLVVHSWVCFVYRLGGYPIGATCSALWCGGIVFETAQLKVKKQGRAGAVFGSKTQVSGCELSSPFSGICRLVSVCRLMVFPLERMPMRTHPTRQKCRGSYYLTTEQYEVGAHSDCRRVNARTITFINIAEIYPLLTNRKGTRGDTALVFRAFCPVLGLT